MAISGGVSPSPFGKGAAPSAGKGLPNAPGLGRGGSSWGRGGGGYGGRVVLGGPVVLRGRGGLPSHPGGTRSAQHAGPRVPRVGPNPLLNPNATLSGSALLSAAKNLTNLQTQGPLSELAREIAQNNAQTAGAAKLTAGYFNQLGQYMNQGIADEGHVGSSLNQQLAQIGQQEQSQLQGVGQNGQQQLASYLPQGDQSVGVPGQQMLAGEIARQQGLASQDTAAMRAAGALQGANYQDLAAADQGAYARAGQQALTGIQQSGIVRDEPLTAKQATINEDYGALLGKNLGALRQQEIANGVARAGLGLRSATLANTAAYDQGRLKEQYSAIGAANQRAAATISAANQRDAANNATRLQIDQMNIAAKQAALNQKLAHSGKGPKALTAAGNNSMSTLLGAAVSALKSGANPLALQEGGYVASVPVRNADGTTGVSHIRIGKIDPGLVRAAHEIMQFGGVTAQTARVLHDMGMRNTVDPLTGQPVKVLRAGPSGQGVGTAANGVASGAQSVGQGIAGVLGLG